MSTMAAPTPLSFHPTLLISHLPKVQKQVLIRIEGFVAWQCFTQTRFTCWYRHASISSILRTCVERRLESDLKAATRTLQSARFSLTLAYLCLKFIWSGCQLRKHTRGLPSKHWMRDSSS